LQPCAFAWPTLSPELCRDVRVVAKAQCGRNENL
jgi:hypothetical protein